MTTASQPFNISLTKRDRQRKLRSGEVVVNTRWVLNYTDPKTGQRVQLFFARQKEAIARRNEIQASVSDLPARARGHHGGRGGDGLAREPA